VSGQLTTTNKQFIHAGPGVVGAPSLSGVGDRSYIDDHIAVSPQRPAVCGLTPDGETWTAHYYHTDEMFNTLALSDDNAEVAESADFDPYGTVVLKDGTGTPISTSAVGNPFLRQGIARDWETGNDDNRYRWYSPFLGRWGQRHPSQFRVGTNLYQHAKSCPTTRRDFSGLAWFLSPLTPSAAPQGPGSPRIPIPCEDEAPPPEGCPCGQTWNPESCACEDNDTCSAGSPCLCNQPPPPPPGPPPCDHYGANDHYLGISERCMCQCMGDDPWSTFVRQCLLCMHLSQCDTSARHDLCFAAGDAIARRPWLRLLMWMHDCSPPQPFDGLCTNPPLLRTSALCTAVGTVE
jgi:RHS repeat-associated protein